MEKLNLFRSLLKAAKRFPIQPVQNKFRSNIRTTFILHRSETQPKRIAELYEAGEATIHLLNWLNRLPKVKTVSLRFPR